VRTALHGKRKMSKFDCAYIEASTCFEFATQIWRSRIKEKYADAATAFERGMKIYNENFVEKNICEDENFEF
jgi:hypothetical protein